MQTRNIKVGTKFKHMKDNSPSLDLFELSVNANDEEIMDKIVSLVGYTKEEIFV